MMRPLRGTTQLRAPWALWFALFVAWVGALAPAVPHAVAWSQGIAPSYLAICSTPGARADNAGGTKVAADSSKKDPQAALSLAHCPFCLHASDRALPAGEPLVFSFPPNSRAPAVASRHAVRYFFTPYIRAAPRGPPVIS